VQRGEAHLVDADAQRDRPPGGGEVGGCADGPKAEARQRSQAGEPARRVSAEKTQDI
jgi:hypothetical protein